MSEENWSDSYKYIAVPPKTLTDDQRDQDIDYAETPGTNMLNGSNFVGLYNEYAYWYKPEFVEAKNTMVKAAYAFLLKYMPEKAKTAMNLQPTFDSVQRGCIKMYTSEWKYGSSSVNVKSFYSFVNHAIFHDNYEQLKRFMPIIRMINAYLCVDTNKNHEQTAIVYRGITLRDSVIAKFVANEECRFATYLSTSYKVQQAVKFAEWSYIRYQNKVSISPTPVEPCSKVIFKIELPAHKHAPHFRTIKELSEVGTEEEVLFVPYSKFCIVKPSVQVSFAGKIYQMIELKAMDNLNENNPKPLGPTKFVPPAIPNTPPTPTTTTAPPSTGKKKPPPTHNFF